MAIMAYVKSYQSSANQSCFPAIAICLADYTGFTERQSYWVPAFMAAIMEGLNHGVDAALSRLWPILVMMLVLLSAAAAWRKYWLR